jgi:hypothetical protein
MLVLEHVRKDDQSLRKVKVVDGGSKGDEIARGRERGQRRVSCSGRRVYREKVSTDKLRLK